MISKCTNHLSNARRPFQMLRLSFEMLKSSSKRPKSAQKEQTMLKTHDRISKCAQIVFKNVRNPHRKSKECSKRTAEPHNVLESTQYHRLSHLQAKKRSESSPNTNSYRQSTILECQQLVPKSDFESLTTGAKYQLWIDVPCSFAMYSGYLKRSCIVFPPRISQLRAKTSNLALLSCRDSRFEREYP